MAAAQPNNRASLLAGLRTGGVRSVSVPHSAHVGGAFNVPRASYSSTAHMQPYYTEQDNVDHLADMVAHNLYVQDARDRSSHQQYTRASNNDGMYEQQQELLLQAQLAAQLSGNAMHPNQAQVQMQMMQMEIMRLQAAAQMNQYTQLQSGVSRNMYSAGHQGMMPASAAPTNQSFNPHQQASYSWDSQGHDVGQYSDLSHQLPPMTASLGGKFGTHVRHAGVPGIQYRMSSAQQNRANVSSPAPITGMSQAATNGLPPSKSDTALSWRRGSTTPESGVEVGLKSTASSSPPFGVIGSKLRPEPLTLTSAKPNAPALAVASGDESDTCYDSASSKSDADPSSSSSPTTPVSGGSGVSIASAREEASKKLFNGLGLGRPAIHVTAPNETPFVARPTRVVSQPIRQPRGPPGAVDELGDQNFANRIRKRAIGGLGVLLEARGKRDSFILQNDQC